MTQQDTTGDGDDVLTLQSLIRARMDERGWNYNDLERLSKGGLTRGRWQQLGTGSRIAAFPEPANITVMAAVLQVEVTTVVLAAARSLGLPVTRRGPDLAQLLPAGTDRLSPRMRDAILTMIRAAVAESLEFARRDAAEDEDMTIEWEKSDEQPRGGRNGVGRPNEA